MKYLISLLVLFLFFACGGTQHTIPNSSLPDNSQKLSSANLLFSSGFEGNVSISKRLDPNALDYRYIEGRDSETGFSWPIEVLGAKGSGLHYIADNNMSSVKSTITRVQGHKGVLSKVLHSVGYENIEDYTQCPYEILDIQDGRKDLYIRFWIKLDSKGLKGIEHKNRWRTFFEWKTHGYATGDGFRLISFIETDEEGNPFWIWQGDRDPQHPIWEIENHHVAVPLDEWFLTEFYWHWSEGSDGRALWRVNHQVIGDNRGATTRNGQALDFIMLGQIYGDASYKEQWIDDIEIWDDLPSDEDKRR